MKELALNPRLKKAGKKLTEGANEEELASMVFQIYEKIKKSKSVNHVSGWCNSERLRMTE
jgi:hypothetical protein